MDVLVTGCGRWTLLVKTIKRFNRNARCSESFRFFVTDDAGYDYRKSPDTRKRIKGWKVIHKSYFPKTQHYGKCVQWLWDQVTDPFFIHLQDDWELMHLVDIDPILKLMHRRKDINQIRFSKRKILAYLKNERGFPGGMPKINVTYGGVKLAAAAKFCMHPSIIRTSYVKGMKFPSGDRSWNPARWEREFTASTCHGIDRRVRKDILKMGCYIYGHIGDPATIKHIGGNSSALIRMRRNRIT